MSIASRRLLRTQRPHNPTMGALRSLRGWAAWGNSSAAARYWTDVVAHPLCANLSVFDKWDQVETSEGVYNLSKAYAVFDIAQTQDKGALYMCILGNTSSGIPDYLISGPNPIPAAERFPGDTAGEWFPVFWSVRAKTRHKALIDAICTKFNNHPAFRAMRCTLLWDTHGEPYMQGNNMSLWISKYSAFTGNTETKSSVQAAYSAYLQEMVTYQASRLNPAVRITMAGGLGLLDAVGTLPVTDPECHPVLKGDYLWARNTYGDRFVPQYNGISAVIDPNPPRSTADAYVRWISACFGPGGSVHAGTIGWQEVGGIGTGGGIEIPPDRYSLMTENCRNFNATFTEIYLTDWNHITQSGIYHDQVLAALTGTTLDTGFS